MEVRCKMEIDTRVIEIMRENGMDVTNQKLILDCSIIYITGQQDILKEQVKELKNEK